MKERLLKKYNVPVPRYTSYPPANYFTEGFTSQTYEEAIRVSNTESPEHLSFYIHMPFCKRLCYYCGCNSYLVNQPDKIEQYLAALHKEIDMVIAQLDSSRKISQIHYGGGTPTIIPIEEIKKLNDRLLSAFGTIENPEIAIECHPGYMNAGYWKELAEAGFNRFSIGIQDFDLQVLKAINRKPSLLPLDIIFAILREKGAKINLDFIYGLPMQTPDSFANTIEKAIELQPDRLVTFSYAHLPHLFPKQQFLERRNMPHEGDKSRMYEWAAGMLGDSGYKPIGLDHFVRPEDELYEAFCRGTLHRNFQGYCSRRTTGQVYAFGITGISQLHSAYIQNTKDINVYLECIEKGKLPIAKGYSLNPQEQVTRTVIETLMCNYRIDWHEVAGRLGMSVEDVKSSIVYNENQLYAFASDGLIWYDDFGIEITPEGTLFARNVAASFDRLMQQPGNKNFSRPV